LALGNGGTNANLTATAGGIVWSNASAFAITSAGTSGYLLQSNGASAPTWVTAPGAAITPTTTNASYYVIGSSSTSGSLTTASESVTSPVFFNPSTGALTAVSHVSSSDERLKQDIETIKNALTKVETMRGVTYLRNGVKEIGVVAQEVERVVPEVVHTQEGEYGYKSVSYGNMVGLLIEAVKELSAEVKELKAKLNDTSE